MGRPKKSIGEKARRLVLYVTPESFSELERHAERKGHTTPTAFLSWFVNAMWTPEVRVKEETRAQE